MSAREPDDAPWTIRRVLRWTTGFFRERGIETARLDAELLIADALGIDRVRVYTEHDRPLNPDELAAIRERVRRRGQREPVAYIVGHRAFDDLDLAVDPRVLIPRPETEGVVEVALARLDARPEDAPPPLVVDVGTGSGAIALAVAKARPSARVVAIDCSAGALAVARANAERNGVTHVEFLEGDLLAPLGDRRPDLVLSNPPYIPTAEVDALMPDVRDYEPRLALDGGPDGLDAIRRLIPAAAERLSPGGGLVLEMGHDQAAAVRALCDARWTDVRVHRDLAGHERILEATRA